jgi:hypothetical protein
VRRIAWCALAVAAACGSDKPASPAPLDAIREPTGVAVVGHRPLVLSSNADLLYDEPTGGTLLSLGVSPQYAVSVLGGVRVHSMGGDLAVARDAARGANVPDAEACQGLVTRPLAVFGTRGSNTLNAVAIGADGSLSCDAPGACGIPTAGAGFGDPLGVAVACGGDHARAYFGYINGQSQAAWIGELDLTTFALRNANVGTGIVRGLAYDRDRERLLLTGATTGAVPTPLRWVNLAACTVGADPSAGGCTMGVVQLPVVTGAYALELHYIALANSAVAGAPAGTPRGATDPIRAYLTGTLYDPSGAAVSGYRTTGFASVLVAADLYEDGAGGVSPRIESIYDVPLGARDVRVLPRPAGWTDPRRRDVVAVVSTDAGALTVIDDETGAVRTFGRDATGSAATGAPILGHQVYGLGVDPEVDGSVAHLWVGSFADGFVTPMDVTLDPVLAATFAGGSHVKITGATP